MQFHEHLKNKGRIDEFFLKVSFKALGQVEILGDKAKIGSDVRTVCG